MMNDEQYKRVVTAILGKDKVHFPEEDKRLKMDSNELKVYNLLPVGYGIRPPVKIKKIRELTGLSERTVYAVIDRLVKVHKVPVVGLRKKPYGYFIAKDIQEATYFSKEYSAQIMAELDRLKALEAAFD